MHLPGFLHKFLVFASKLASAIVDQRRRYANIVSKIDKRLTSIGSQRHWYDSSKLALSVDIHAKIAKF
jgi:hypothetical protein